MNLKIGKLKIGIAIKQYFYSFLKVGESGYPLHGKVLKVIGIVPFQNKNGSCPELLQNLW